MRCKAASTEIRHRKWAWTEAVVIVDCHCHIERGLCKVEFCRWGCNAVSEMEFEFADVGRNIFPIYWGRCNIVGVVTRLSDKWGKATTAGDKREEFLVTYERKIRFGDGCKDIQPWEEIDSELAGVNSIRRWEMKQKIQFGSFLDGQARYFVFVKHQDILYS